ncbi:peptidoglycan DD-metalloendopeptidase family protein [Psychromonas aquimarina]|uniref:peptidoglycan DD-metalloendopeptidase family protein n=1 Tax=Psychromonas aquimarina TaxID=444919 RepID=UPI0003F4F332|nr:peptidoglycan DD-metalloendopeptidase family protein [Psychromonas aquimarina]
MLFLTRLKAFISFINNMPRQHFFALIILFVFLLVISFIPARDPAEKTIKRQLVLPTAVVPSDDYAVAEPITADKGEYDKALPDFSGNQEVEVEIKAGDTLSGIFQKEGLSAALLQELLEVDKQYLRLGNLLPGQHVKLLISPENKLLALKVIIDRANTLTFTLKDEQYVSLLETKPGDWRNSSFQGSVNGSFYIDAKEAGLSAGQIQQVSSALQDKFDFNRQLRPGDSFHVLVAKKYIDGEYSFESEVLAILIKTRHQTFSAFLNEDGRYYDTEGNGLTKAYRRYPLNGKYRISSPFNNKRLHPITKRISPHNGTDFAAPTGTKVYAVGDGVVIRAGYHPAAGNYIVIKHGRKYTTRFLHLSKILVRKGQRVKMGTLIAKSGNTGRSTGPHLHYEFHVYNKPVNAMKVDLPLSQKVPQKQQKAFVKRRDLFLKEMSQTYASL